MAYAAVISLKLTINSLLHYSSDHRVSFSRSFLHFAYDEATTLQGVLERLGDDISRSSSSEGVTALDGQIRDCAHGLEDALEFNRSDVEGEIGSFAEQVKRLEEEFIQELSKQDDGNDDAATHGQDFSSKNNIDSGVELVGYSSQLFITIRDHMIRKMRPDDLYFVSLLGEVGTGTSVVAKIIFEDLVVCSFDCSAWVRVGAECELKEVLIRILAQVDNLAAAEYDWLHQLDDEKLICKQLLKALKHRKYMIVLDTVSNLQLIQCLKSSCPDQSNGSLVLFTTASEEVALLADITQSVKRPTPLFEEKMLLFLRCLCFGDVPICAELEEAGIMIVRNCQGHAISVAKAYLFLDTTDKSLEQWSKLAADEHNPIFMVQDELSEVFEMKTKIQSIKERDEDTAEVLNRISVAFYDSIEGFEREIHPQRFFPKMEIISIMGMAGIGKTTLARKIYRDMSTMRQFDCHVWLTLGPKYQTEEILIDILACIYPSIDRRHMKGDANLASQLFEQLSDKRFLIVLDDLWIQEPLHQLKISFPNIKGTTLVTTRLAKVASFSGGDIGYEVPLLNNEDSWYLLREKVFAGGLCPQEFEEGGRKIAENCDGLPLLIITVAEQLLKVEISLEYWNNVATGKDKSPVFMNAHDDISKALLPSYESLPQHLKACFLYIGVFRNMYAIPTSVLIKLLIAEGFLEPTSPQVMEAFIGECLFELVNRSLVLIQRKMSHIQIKKCRQHSVFWHLSNSEAAKNKTFHAMNSLVDCSAESIEGQRRLSIRNSVLLGIKDVYNAMEKSCLNLRSLLCTGLPHQYPVPLYFGSRLLRVLDALAIRFYEFPIEVVKLIHLKYLGLTCNGKLPSSISQLWKLQYLIVSRHFTTENSTLLPIEIWDMKELKHLQVMGGRLPNPKRGNGLRKLATLLDVSAQSCTKQVLKRIPNLKRLGIRIKLNPNDKGNHPFYSLNNISQLRRLESLKCVVVNPHMRSEFGSPPAPVSMFPSGLKRLSLSGFGYPWEYMNYIGALENLEELKLKSYAFRGPKWDIGFNVQFSKLKFMLLEDTDLECWKAPFFSELRRLSLKHCYKLQEIPISFNVLDKSPIFVEMVDCNPATMSWAEQIGRIIPHCVVAVSQSWIDK